MNSKRKLLFRDAFFCLLLAGAFIVSVSFLVVNLSIFDPFTGAFKDFSFLDLYYSEQLAEKKASQEIILVNVEQADRFQIQDLMAHVQEQGPKVIGLDIIFKGNKDPFMDSLLRKQLEKENVVQAKAYVNGQWNYDFSNTEKKLNKTGYTNLNFGSEETVIRSFQAYNTIEDTLHASLSATVVGKYLEHKWPSEKLKEKLSKEQSIYYTGNMDSFITFSYQEAMAMDTIPVMKDKIILLGYLGFPHASPTDVEDKFFTPLNSVNAGKSIPDMFGVLIHANIILMMLTDTYFWIVPQWALILCTLILTYFGLAFFIWLNIKNAESYALSLKIAQLGISVLLLWLALWLFSKRVVFEPELMIAFLVISVEFIELYALISHKLNIKYQWKSYFYPD